MFWEHEDWSTLDAGQLADALALVRAGLPKHERGAFTLVDRDDPHAIDDEGLRVRSIRVRRLSFYRDHWLYELGVSPEAAGFANRYESARAFVVVSPTDASEAPAAEIVVPLPPHRRPALADRENAVSAVLLDWSSGVIYQLNERARMRLSRDGRVDRQLALEYLDFFVSFIGGADSREPFLLLDGGTLAQPAGIPRQQASLSPFEQAIGEHSRGGAEIRRRPRWDFIPESASSTDDPDFDWIGTPATGPGTQRDEPVAQAATAPATASGSGAAPARAPATTAIPRIQIGEQPPERAAVSFVAAVLYEGRIFSARFELSCEADGTTAVRMLDDEPLAQADPALLQYQIDRLDARGIRLLLLLKPRTEITAAGFLAKLRKAAAASALSPAAWVENVRVSGDVNLQLLAVDGPLRVRDVEFMGRVVLDECRRGASVVLERCRIARSLEARNCVIDGDLVLRSTVVLGATADVDPLPPAVCLEGLRLTGGLDAQQMAVLGEFAAPNADIGGKAALCGMHQARRFDRELAGVTMPNASVKAGVDLSPHAAFDAVARRVSRTRIEGQVKLAGLQAPQVDMRGAACLEVDLSWARLDGLFNLGTFDPSPANPHAIGNRQMRAIVQWDVNLRGAHAREIVLAGARVIAGDMTMINAEIDGSLFARPGMPPAYRTRIGNAVTLSSARIRGDADFDGASIGGALEMRTGSLGRLFMSMHPSVWAREDEVLLDWFAAEAGRIELIGVTGLGTIGLAGVQIGGAAGQIGGVLVEHVESRGDVRFYWGPREQGVFGRALNEARAHVVQRTGGVAASGDGAAPAPHQPDRLTWQREASPQTCSARVRGDVEMRRIVTDGCVDLTNMKVIGGGVRLNDARIGTDLFARRSWLRGPAFVQARDGCAPPSGPGPDHCTLALECSVVDLDNAQVGGDALLSGMNLRGAGDGEGRFLGRGLQVGGKLEFHAGVGCMAQIEGGIDLAGARAAELRLPDTDALRASAAAGTSPMVATHGPVSLERGRFGKLCIAQPIPRLHLGGIDVDNWELGPHRAQAADEAAAGANAVDGSIEILKNMRPMDRSVWIGVESRLRNEAQARDADRVYRAMRNHEQVNRLRAIPKFFSRWLYGYGTRVAPAIGLWLLLSLALFAMLRQPGNVKVSDNVLLQLGGQCRTVQERAGSGSSAAIGGAAGAGAATGPSSALPAKCVAYFAAIDGTTAPSIEITAAQLVAAGAQPGYDFGDAMLLSLRYAIPFIGAFGDPDWVPAEQPPARIGTAAAVPVDVGLAPSILAAVVLLVNSLLLSFAAAFVAKRWLR